MSYSVFNLPIHYSPEKIIRKKNNKYLVGILCVEKQQGNCQSALVCGSVAIVEKVNKTTCLEKWQYFIIRHRDHNKKTKWKIFQHY